MVWNTSQRESKQTLAKHYKYLPVSHNRKFICSLHENRSKPNHQILLSTSTPCRHVEATGLLFLLQLLCPVVLFEQVSLYNLEEAEMVRPGSQLTILTCFRMRFHLRRLLHVVPPPLPQPGAPESPFLPRSTALLRFAPGIR